MKVYKNLSIEIPGTNVHYFNLDDFDDESSNESLYYGYSWLENGVDRDTLNKYERNVYLNVTTPTEFCSPQPTEADDIFDEVYGICPFTNQWLNEIKTKPRYKTIFYPFNKNDIPKNSEKKFDVIYIDGSHLYKDVKKDLNNSIKCLNRNGILICDDFLWFGYKNIRDNPLVAILNFFYSYKHKLEILFINYQVIFRKK